MSNVQHWPDLESHSLYFLPVGGTGEIGMNLNLYAFNGQYLLVDLGVMFGDETTPGVEVITPDIRALEAIKDKIVGLVLTHAHEDHLGALQYLWPKLRCPVYATSFTARVAQRKIKNLSDKDQKALKMHKVKPGAPIEIGLFRVEWLHLTHSIPEPNGLVIDVADQRVFHTGDWKLDPNPVVGDSYDAKRLEEIAADGVDWVICDSTNATTPGWSGSESEAAKALEKVLAGHEGRLAVSCFASNVARVKSLGLLAAKLGRRVSILGRSMHEMTQAAKIEGYLAGFPNLVPSSDLGYLPRNEQLILCTGSQGEPRAALSKLASDTHPDLHLEEGDTVVFSSKQIPGNEKPIARMRNQFAVAGIKVIDGESNGIHVSGHPCVEELKWMYQTLMPTHVIPVHGEPRHLKANANIARDCGANAVEIRNGDLVNLSRAQVVGKVFTGRLGLTGNSLIPTTGAVLRDRHKLKHHGSVMATVVMDAKGVLVAPPAVRLMGLVDKSQDERVVEEILQKMRDALKALGPMSLTDDAAVESALGDAIRRYCWRTLSQRPVVQVMLARL